MDIFEKIASGVYENHVPYSVDKVPVDEDTMTVTQAKAHVESEKQRVKDQRNKHREEQRRLDELFRRDLEEEHGTTGHPKANKMWEYAWDEGHSGGYNDVANTYARIVGFVDLQNPD